MKKWKQTKIETKVHLYEFKTQNQNCNHLPTVTQFGPRIRENGEKLTYVCRGERKKNNG